MTPRYKQSSMKLRSQGGGIGILDLCMPYLSRGGNQCKKNSVEMTNISSHNNIVSLKAWYSEVGLKIFWKRGCKKEIQEVRR